MGASIHILGEEHYKLNQAYARSKLAQEILHLEIQKIGLRMQELYHRVQEVGKDPEMELCVHNYANLAEKRQRSICLYQVLTEQCNRLNMQLQQLCLGCSPLVTPLPLSSLPTFNQPLTTDDTSVDEFAPAFPNTSYLVFECLNLASTASMKSPVILSSDGPAVFDFSSCSDETRDIAVKSLSATLTEAAPKYAGGQLVQWQPGVHEATQAMPSALQAHTANLVPKVAIAPTWQPLEKRRKLCPECTLPRCDGSSTRCWLWQLLDHIPGPVIVKASDVKGNWFLLKTWRLYRDLKREVAANRLAIPCNPPRIHALESLLQKADILIKGCHLRGYVDRPLSSILHDPILRRLRLVPPKTQSVQ
ncbi:hypothetical protein BCR37DRAFT_388208 [Protomyces lactucae-debilis]|uniref:Uncharacterized protein n=1 Tax=Protomyces lactucae-debilis TaxID=2754530 RepID=A0A1Y2F9B8_PROLT|nr:uncharacterized protein BCR37DRAFT_388208 [Protomyces lactucae-debilis]ORY80501.1 hypothetical protein BCR37DRAFT_388208 [Protomyces lactucae-debilis]